MMLKELGKLIP